MTENQTTWDLCKGINKPEQQILSRKSSFDQGNQPVPLALWDYQIHRTREQRTPASRLLTGTDSSSRQYRTAAHPPPVLQTDDSHPSEQERKHSMRGVCSPDFPGFAVKSNLQYQRHMAKSRCHLLPGQCSRKVRAGSEHGPAKPSSTERVTEPYTVTSTSGETTRGLHGARPALVLARTVCCQLSWF